MNVPTRLFLLLAAALLASCSAKVDGPTPQLTVVRSPTGTNVICTCDAIDGCEKKNPDILTLSGAGFAPLPVLLLGEPGLELPDVTLKGPAELQISGRDPARNPAGVTLRWKTEAEMELTLPPEVVKTLPPGKYEVTVANPNGNASSLKDGLEVVLGPRVLKVSPENVCPTVDQAVTVSGENFRPKARVALIKDQTTIAIPEEKTTFDEQTGTIGIVIAQNTVAVGDYDVQVILAEGCSHTLKNALHMVPPPTLESIEPAVACTQLDRTVTLKGKDFRSGASVSIDGKPLPAADVKLINPTAIEITVRAGLAIGVHDVTVTNPEGCSSTLKGGLQVVPPPTLTKVAPATVCTGGKVTLTGTGFLPGASVTIGTAVLTGSAVSVVNETTIEAEVGPIAPGGPYDVKVTNADGCGSGVLTAALTITQGPIVVAVDPSTVYNKVDFPIAIFGSGFKPGLTVSLGTVPATALTGVQVNPTGDRVDAIVPKGITPGTYDLTVKDTGGCAYTLKAAVKVIDQLTLTICGIDPPFGYTGEKTAVTITSGTPGQAGCPASTTTVQFASTPRAWLDVGGVLKAIRSVAFVTATSLTGTVEAGLAPGGPYDLLVQNPDGQIGLLTKAFKVVDKPVPLIEAVSPGAIDTQFVGTLALTGKNFRAPVTIELISAAGTKTALTTPAAPGTTQASGGLDVGAAALTVGAYLVRLTNTDQGTYYDFSSLAITNPAGNLTSWQTAASQLGTARRRHAMAAGRVTAAARYLYVLGGDPGGATPAPLDSVELVPLDKFGNTGSWTAQRYKLPKGRTGLSAFVRGRFLYALGGHDGTAPVKTVSRAQILDPAQAPEVTTFTFTLGGTLAKGAWYYRVAAVLPASDPVNPGGETLPSDPVVIQAIDQVKVSLTWKPVATAVSYSLYRTPAANGVSGGEQLLKSGILPATACTATACSFEDTGLAIENAGQTPLPLGATGVFVEQGIPQLSVARSDAALTLAPDPAGALQVYLAGGRSSATAIESTIERATISSDGATLGVFVAAGATLDAPREKLMLVVGEHATSPAVPPTSVYLFAAGGAGAAPTKNGGSLSVASGGALGAFTVSAALKTVPVAAVGYLVNNTFYYFGGAADGVTANALASSCELTVPPAFKNCNSLAAGQLPAAKMHAALTLESAFFYISGGGATATAASKDVIKTPW